MREFSKLIFNKRFRQVFFLFLSFGFQFWWLGKRRKYISPEKAAKKYQYMYTEQARRFTKVALELQGLLIKLGQFFSSRVDILPKAYTDELAELQDAVKPVETRKIVARIESESRQKLDEMFLHFSEEPLAAASLGQVHAAKLITGESVAVKVLRPGIEETVAIDLKTIKILLAIAKRFTIFAKSIDLDAVYVEFNETINDELDYVKEGHSAEKFQKNFADDSRIYVPKIYWKYTFKKMLVMEYINGVKITEFNSLKDTEVAKKLAETIFSSYLQQVLVDGFFHADPHPGNLLVKEDGTLVFIDFGMMGYVDKNMKENMVAIVLAILKQDAGAVVDAFVSLGFLRPHADRSIIVKNVKLLLNRFFGEEIRVETLDFNEIALEIRELMYTQPFQIPARTTFLGKALGTLLGICNGLDNEFDIVKVGKPYISALFPDNAEGTNDGFGMVFDQAKKIALEVVGLPEKISRLVNGLESGELRIHPSKSFESNILENQAALANRTIKAILAAGLGIIGSIFYTGNAPEIGIPLLVVSGLFALASLRRKRIEKLSDRIMRAEPPGFKRPKIR